MDNSICVGIEGRKQIIVTADRLATAYCSGTLEVFATPAMIAMMEQTAMDSVALHLAEGQSTVGTEVSIKHLKATLRGKIVTSYSKLTQIEGKKLVFEVEASDEKGLIGKGTHTRYVVNIEEFFNRIKD